MTNNLQNLRKAKSFKKEEEKSKPLPFLNQKKEKL